MTDEKTDERIRMAIEEAVARALADGWPPDAVREEVDYAIESYEA